MFNLPAPCRRWHFEDFLAILFLAITLIALLGGCAPTLTRLAPGDCVVIAEKGEIIAVGQDCRIQRVYR